jgi:hypothetical protein
VIHYVSTQGGRKNITIESNEIVEMNDCERIINEQEIEHQWVSIIDETNSSVEKMEKATKDVESYMSESGEKSENKKSSKKK